MPGSICTSQPVNMNHPLNQGRNSWLLTLPWLAGGPTWPDLMGNPPAKLVNMNNTANGWQPTKRPGGWGCVQFDGAAGSVNHSAYMPAVPLACAAWILPQGAQQTNPSIFTTTGSSGALILYISNYGSSYSLVATDYYASSIGNSTNSPKLSASVWARVMFVYNSGNYYFFIDGQPLGTGTSSTVVKSQPISLALAYATSHLYQGLMDDVTTWSGNALAVSSPAAFAAMDYDLSSRGYPGVLRRN